MPVIIKNLSSFAIRKQLSEALINSGNVEDIKNLIVTGDIDINQPDPLGEKYIYIAVENASLAVCIYLIEEKNANLEAINNENLFQYALNRPDILAYLADPVKKLYLRFYDGTDDFIAAAVRSDKGMLMHLLDAKPELINYEVNNFQSVFYWAALTGNHKIILKLIAHSTYKCLSDEIKGALLNDAGEAFKEHADDFKFENDNVSRLFWLQIAFMYFEKALKLGCKEIDREELGEFALEIVEFKKINCNRLKRYKVAGFNAILKLHRLTLECLPTIFELEAEQTIDQSVNANAENNVHFRQNSSKHLFFLPEPLITTTCLHPPDSNNQQPKVC